MKKADLKQLMKPIVKECIHEILLEEGLLSNIVSEVATGLKGSPLREHTEPTPRQAAPDMQRQSEDSRAQIQAYRENMMNSIGKDAYNGVNLFEGTDPLHNAPAPQKGQADLGDPRDAGVDISSLVGNSSAIWQALK